MSEIVEKAKQLFLENISKHGSDPYTLEDHVFEVEKWAKKLFISNPLANEEIVSLGAWLHDFGHYPINPEEDHAITSERKAKEFLEKENYDKSKTEKVLHCIRSHRCRDVMPETIEAKILACSDSASHLTSTMYFDILKIAKNEHTPYSALGKLERDYRDVSLFPEIKKEITPLYDSWKALLTAYEKLEY
jgi:hypothetical protein